MDNDKQNEISIRNGLPHAVRTYFDLMDGPNKAQVTTTFAPDAVVIDDGHTYVGHSAIRAWLDGPAGQFKTTSTWLFADRTPSGTVVGILIKGNFPGGRVELRHEFIHRDEGLIAALTITA